MWYLIEHYAHPEYIGLLSERLFIYNHVLIATDRIKILGYTVNQAAPSPGVETLAACVNNRS